jgi:glycosyltransferase involved in cell wall biosynthesis
MISIYTFTLGREKYLKDIFDCNQYDLEIEHFICFQGCKLPNIEIPSRFKLLNWDKNYGIAEGMNRILPMLSGDLIMKMDDDCKIISPNFFTHVREIARLCPGTVFSPYPVGLIRNPGGPKALGHKVIYSEKTDTYYTLRFVDHVGGFARISPSFTKYWKFDNDLAVGQSGNEDVQFSTRCKLEKIPMMYLENAIVVEHQESTLGQHERYKDYFYERF